MGLLTKIINFFIILKIYYWFSFYPLAKGLLLLNMKLLFDGHRYWANRTCEYLKVKFVKLKNSFNFVDEKRMIFANHKSQADFFVHNHILNYQANFLSRYAVALLIPAFFSAYETVWFFNRGKKSDPEEFNRWLDRKFEASPRKSLVAYIEGHRMTGSMKVDQQKLKTGMIRYAYRRKIPSQILMTFGNQNIFNEKKLSVGFGQTAYYKFSDVINPAKFATEDEFVSHIKQKFADFFNESYKEVLEQVATAAKTA